MCAQPPAGYSPFSGLLLAGLTDIVMKHWRRDGHVWYYDPWTGEKRDPREVVADPHGLDIHHKEWDTKTWQHDETGRITVSPVCPGPRWSEVPDPPRLPTVEEDRVLRNAVRGKLVAPGKLVSDVVACEFPLCAVHHICARNCERNAAPVDVVAQERERCAGLCEDLAKMMEDGAGEREPGGRLRQAARNIRDPEHKPLGIGTAGYSCVQCGASNDIAQHNKPSGYVCPYLADRVTLPADARWEFRFFDTSNEPHHWREWEPLVPRFNGHQHVQEMRDYIASGYRYQMRQIHAGPAEGWKESDCG